MKCMHVHISARWRCIKQMQLPTADLDDCEQPLVIELAYHVGDSCEEIASIMQCPLKTVKTRMLHARRELKTSSPAWRDLTTGGHPRC